MPKGGLISGKRERKNYSDIFSKRPKRSKQLDRSKESEFVINEQGVLVDSEGHDKTDNWESAGESMKEVAEIWKSEVGPDSKEHKIASRKATQTLSMVKKSREGTLIDEWEKDPTKIDVLGIDTPGSKDPIKINRKEFLNLPKEERIKLTPDDVIPHVDLVVDQILKEKPYSSLDEIANEIITRYPRFIRTYDEKTGRFFPSLDVELHGLNLNNLKSKIISSIQKEELSHIMPRLKSQIYSTIKEKQKTGLTREDIIEDILNKNPSILNDIGQTEILKEEIEKILNRMQTDDLFSKLDLYEYGTYYIDNEGVKNRIKSVKKLLFPGKERREELERLNNLID